MSVTDLVSVEEYLHSTFEPDAEYVEGKIVPRAVPQKPHSGMQGFLVRALYAQAHPLHYEVWPEQRIRTRRDPAHYRVPDLCITYGEPPEDIFSAAPFLCIEILSPDDSALELRAKIDEYLGFGVHYVWVIDPQTLTGEIHTASGIARVSDGVFTAGPISVSLT